ncbi:hypothetical protein GTZ99_08880 [Novosphingobium sp. FSY-8]|uniref:Membrane-anchored protein n=1 Tax=Novosphingobium ovatum TaxID=1908523 RepID=A0ABW9XDR0_9SPHN|nr:hypothetical protein [Novosphingobium ovatum]NBC36671.1 hypothetical protein [Novosphingobium ovatum]
MQDTSKALAKVPAITLGFWAIKIFATTLGETAGDTVSMSWLGETTAQATGWGYLIGTGLFLLPLIVLVAAQIRAKAFHPLLYWSTIIASTTAGTTLADYFDRSLGIGYLGGSLSLFACVVASLAIWKHRLGSVSVGSISSPQAELFYWITITFSQTLGTALGDWTADSFGEATFMGLESGYVLGALVFAAALAAVALAWCWTGISRAALFWMAFILTRPLGATVGDFLDKPLDKGGLDFSRPIASLVLLLAMGLCLMLLPQRAASADAAH